MLVTPRLTESSSSDGLFFYFDHERIRMIKHNTVAVFICFYKIKKGYFCCSQFSIFSRLKTSCYVWRCSTPQTSFADYEGSH